MPIEENLYKVLTFFEDFIDLALLDSFTMRKEIMLDLKSNFKNTLDFRQQFSESISSAFYTQKIQSDTSLKRLIVACVWCCCNFFIQIKEC